MLMATQTVNKGCLNPSLRDFYIANPLHLIKRDLIARPIIELRRPRRLVRGDQLRILDRPVGHRATIEVQKSLQSAVI